MLNGFNEFVVQHLEVIYLSISIFVVILFIVDIIGIVTAKFNIKTALLIITALCWIAFVLLQYAFKELVSGIPYYVLLGILILEPIIVSITFIRVIMTGDSGKKLK